MAKRRGQNEGSIYQMKDGRWRAAVSVGWKPNDTGEVVWKRKVITARTRLDVQQQLTEVLRNRDRGLTIANDKQTLGSFLTAWLANTVKPSVRQKTYRSYEQMVRNHIVKSTPQSEWKSRELDKVSGLGNVRLSKLTLQKVQEWMNAKLQAGNSASLVRYLRVVLRIALNEAVKDDLMPRNPAALATPPRVKTREVEPFNPEQASRFLKASQGHRLEALFTVALAVGLRSGEASALQWPNVDLDNGTIAVRSTLQRRKGEGLVLLPPKSDKSRRLIEIPRVCVEALRSHAERQRSERAWAGSKWKESGHVFTSMIGTPLDDRKVLQQFKALVSAAGLPKQRFHDLRHACVSLLGAQGVPVKVISEIVGHSDIRLTQNLYQHVFQPAKREAADRMDDLFDRIAPSSVATKRTERQLN